MTDPLVDCAKSSFFRLTLESCTRNYRLAATDKHATGYFRDNCHGCDLGHMRCFGKPKTTPAPSSKARLWCVRCGEDTHRLIDKNHCLSCYNRQRETTAKEARRNGILPLQLETIQVQAALPDAAPVLVQAVGQHAGEVAKRALRAKKGAVVARGLAHG
jgi:hypothetical protein